MLSKGIAEDKRKYCVVFFVVENFKIMTPRGRNDRTKHCDTVFKKMDANVDKTIVP